MGSALVGAVLRGDFGESVSALANGMALIVGAAGNDSCGLSSGHARVLAYSSTTSKRNRLRSTLVRAASGDEFRNSVSMPANGMTVAVGARENNDNRESSGHVRLFSHSPATNKWNQLGSALAGAASGDEFGTSVLTSADGMTVVAGAPCNRGNGENSGHVRILRLKDIILNKEHG